MATKFAARMVLLLVKALDFVRRLLAKLETGLYEKWFRLATGFRGFDSLRPIIPTQPDVEVICHYCHNCDVQTNHLVYRANNVMLLGEPDGSFAMLHVCLECGIGSHHLHLGDSAKTTALEESQLDFIPQPRSLLDSERGFF